MAPCWCLPSFSSVCTTVIRSYISLSSVAVSCIVTKQLRCSSLMLHRIFYLLPSKSFFIGPLLWFQHIVISSIVCKRILYEMPSSKEYPVLPLFQKTRRLSATDSLQGNLDHDSILSLSNERQTSTWRQSMGGFAHSVLLKARNSIDTMRGAPFSRYP